MKKYKVIVTEIHGGYCLIEAETPEEADEKYHEGDYDGEMIHTFCQDDVELVELVDDEPRQNI